MLELAPPPAGNAIERKDLRTIGKEYNETATFKATQQVPQLLQRSICPPGSATSSIVINGTLTTSIPDLLTDKYGN